MNVKAKPRSWYMRQGLFFLCLVLVTSAVLVFSLDSGYTLTVNDVAPHDIRATKDFSYISEIRTQQAQNEAVRRVAPIYTSPDSKVARQQYERARQVLAYLRELRADTYATESQRYAWVLAVPELRNLPLSTVDTLLNLPDVSWNRVHLEFLDLLDQVMRQESIREEDLEGLRRRLSALVALDLEQDEAVVVSDLVASFLRPNVFYDSEATEAARQSAREALSPTFENFRRGEVIVREGDAISDLDMEALAALGLTSPQRDVIEYGGIFLFSLGSVVMLGVYLGRLHIDVLDAAKQEMLLTVLLTFFLLLAWLLVPSGELLRYLFPGAAAAMVLATTLGKTTAVGGIIFLGGVCGWIADYSLGFAALVIVSGIFASLNLPRYEQTGALFRSGLLAGLMSAVVLFVFNVEGPEADPLSFLLKVGICVSGGIISGGLTVGGLFLLTPLFDLTTNFRLMELSRPNHPLLQRLLREAPATFNHVMMVASLSEQAAERIGANALLTRVGAYYHDIGKLLRPYFFVENQQGLSNPHDRLDPYTSVDVLFGHVRDGMALAQQYHLPAKVRAFIPEHHGTMRASFFYQKAVEAAGSEGDLIDESQFHYPGPTPQSRETLLVMLADGCEAATRARRPSTPEELAGVVDFIFEERIRAGQLDLCPITMQELHTAKKTYIDLLRGAYHPRVKYPEPKKDKDIDNETETSH